MPEEKKREPQKKAEIPKNKEGKPAEDPKDAQIKDLTDTLQRLQAEFENYKKRIEKDALLFKKYATQDFIIKLLPVLDSFEFALKNTNTDKDRLSSPQGKTNLEETPSFDKFIKGIQMIYAQLYGVLEAEGLKQIDSVGKRFDPYYHEVLLHEQSDKEDEIILEELQKGYMINDRVIRFAKVKISKKA